METIREAIDRLETKGFRDRIDVRDGCLRFNAPRAADQPPAKLCDPHDVHVDEVVRFEGMSDPSDSSVVFALSDPRSGRRGTWTLSFGPDMNPEATELALRLPHEVH